MNSSSDNQSIHLPDDVVLSVRHVSKKFCRNLKRSMLYGMQDLGRNLLGLRPRRDLGRKTRDQRPETTDQRSGGAEGGGVQTALPQSQVSGLGSQVSSSGLRRDEFWALRDISFDLRKGECLGLIGQNGSGKTTLLRLLTGIFPPDAGEVWIKGSVGGVIALGAGFHPHLTGRENIYLNGTILGMTRTEIEAKISAIIDFADISGFIDAPVSTYSSGMHVRLGFAIATAREPDLLLLDEVLAVGDASFRHKCYTRIGNLQKKAAVIFVSHNMDQVAQMCNRVLLLRDGRIQLLDRSDEVITRYLFETQPGDTEGQAVERVTEPISVGEIRISSNQVNYAETVVATIAVTSQCNLENCALRFVFYDSQGAIVAEWNSKRLSKTINLHEGLNTLEITLGPLLLRPSLYRLGVALLDRTGVCPLLWSFKKHAITIAGNYGGACAYQLG